MQLREKDLDGAALLLLGASLRAVTARAGVPLLVNDRVDVALAVGADGVHLPADGLRVAEVRRLWPAALVGASTHSEAELERAAEDGADFAVLGPVFDTPSKRAFGSPLGLEGFAARSRKIAARWPSLPVFALGGVDAARAPLLRAAGAAGVGCISAVLAADDPGAAALRLYTAFMS